MNWRYLDRFELTHKALIYLIPILAVLGIAVPAYFEKYDLALLGSYLAIPMILSTLIYLLHRQVPHERPAFMDKDYHLLLSTIFFIGLAVSLILLYVFPIRPTAYYIVVTVMAAAILLQCLPSGISKHRTAFILIQMMILVMDILWGANLKYYFFIGTTDSIGASWIAYNLIADGHISEVFDVYKPFPLWFILVSSMNHILNIPVPAHKMMFFTNGIIYSFIAPATYIVSLTVFKNKNTALVSALFTALYLDIIFYGLYSIARSIVTFLTVILLILLLSRSDQRKIALSIILTMSMVMYHTASMPFIFMIFFAALIFEKFYSLERAEKFITGNYLKIILALTFTYWMYFAGDLMRLVLKNFVDPPARTITLVTRYATSEEVFNYLSYSALLIFIIIGALSSIRSERYSKIERIFCILGLSLAAISFPGPMLLLNKLMANFNLSRATEYTFLFLNCVGAVGFCGLYYRKKKHLKAAAMTIFLILVFLSITNDFVASDNPLVKRTFYTFFFTECEIDSFNHIANLTRGYMMTDSTAAIYLNNSRYSQKGHILEANGAETALLRNSTEDTIIIRRGELAKRPLKLFFSDDDTFELHPGWANKLTYFESDQMIWKALNKYSKVYDSGGMAAFN